MSHPCLGLASGSFHLDFLIVHKKLKNIFNSKNKYFIRNNFNINYQKVKKIHTYIHISTHNIQNRTSTARKKVCTSHNSANPQLVHHFKYLFKKLHKKWKGRNDIYLQLIKHISTMATLQSGHLHPSSFSTFSLPDITPHFSIVYSSEYSYTSS